MHYEINVSKNGQHFFATHERSITSQAKLSEILSELVKAFPVEKGYEIQVTKQLRVSTAVYFDAHSDSDKIRFSESIFLET